MNIDWYVPLFIIQFDNHLIYHSIRFQAMKGRTRCHSTSAFCAVICNNPHSIHYLPEETILVMVIPGPTELLLEQINNLLQPFINSMLQLEDGTQLSNITCLA